MTKFHTFGRIFDKRGAIAIESVIDYDEYEVLRSPKALINNNSFKVYRGKKALDLIAYCDTTNFAISEKVKKLLEDNKITGWSCYPIKIDKVKEQYYGFQITGIGGEVTNRDKDSCVPMFEPIQWDKSQWDGSDIFLLKNAGTKVCTEKVKNILEKEKVTNLEFDGTYSKLSD